MAAIAPRETATALDRLCVDTIRVLTMDAVQRARSGHPGLPMAMAPVAHVLYTRFLRHDPADPAWPDPGSVRPAGRARVDGCPPVFEPLKRRHDLGAQRDGDRREPVVLPYSFRRPFAYARRTIQMRLGSQIPTSWECPLPQGGKSG